tara:strand:+ start:3145 stop:3915 length:771 start_codon:yes stop_codon:yes gene_type:complete
MKLTNNTIKKTMNILEERKTVKENFSRMDSLQGSNAMEKAFTAVDLSTLISTALPYLDEEEKEILKYELLKIVMVLPDAELAEIYDTVVASAKGVSERKEQISEKISDEEKAAMDAVRNKNYDNLGQGGSGEIYLDKDGIYKDRGDEMSFGEKARTAMGMPSRLDKRRAKNRELFASPENQERIAKFVADKKREPERQAARRQFQIDREQEEYSRNKERAKKEKEREDREYHRMKDAEDQAKKDRDTDYLRNIGRI